MKTIFTLAGVAALAIAGPAVAAPGGHGHGQHSTMHSTHVTTRTVHTNARVRTNSRNRVYHSSRMSSHYGRHDNGNHYGQLKSHHRMAARFSRGQRYRSGYGTYYTYNRIPLSIRQQYDLNNDYRYYYNDGYLYAVNPRTMLVQQVISALLR